MTNLDPKIGLTDSEIETYQNLEQRKKEDVNERDVNTILFWNRFQENNVRLAPTEASREKLKAQARKTEGQAHTVSENITKFLEGKEGWFAKYIAAPLAITTVPYFQLKAKFNEWRLQKVEAKYEKILSKEKEILKSFNNYQDAEKFVAGLKENPDRKTFGAQLAQFIGSGEDGHQRFHHFITQSSKQKLYFPPKVIGHLVFFNDQSKEYREKNLDKLARVLQRDIDQNPEPVSKKELQSRLGRLESEQSTIKSDILESIKAGAKPSELIKELEDTLQRFSEPLRKTQGQLIARTAIRIVNTAVGHYNASTPTPDKIPDFEPLKEDITTAKAILKDENTLIYRYMSELQGKTQ